MTSETPATRTPVTLTPEVLADLRRPFPEESIGKRPTVFCKSCRNSPTKVCPSHQKVTCGGCGQKITTAHMHLDYVGHAQVTDRLLAIDPDWNWEPLAYAENGLPLFDEHHGLWAHLTIAGKTMLCYGSAPGKPWGPDAVKEIIGDMIRNGALRFGVAIDLWGATFRDGLEGGSDLDTVPAEFAQMIAPANTTQRRSISQKWKILGFGGDANIANRIAVTSKIVGRDIADENDITGDEAVTIIDALTTRIGVVTTQQTAPAATPEPESA